MKSTLKLINRSLSILTIILFASNYIHSQTYSEPDAYINYPGEIFQKYSFNSLFEKYHFLDLLEKESINCAFVDDNPNTGVRLYSKRNRQYVISKADSIFGLIPYYSRVFSDEEQARVIADARVKYSIKANSLYKSITDGETDSQAFCEDAGVFCGSNQYSFPGSVNAPSAQVGAFYDCLLSQPNPTWYFMQIGNPGPISIQMSSSPSYDIDFICWGPFDSPTGACVEGLTASTVIECSFSDAAIETCDIPNPVAGKFYILLITNYDNKPCEITFSQISGTGSTNCNIVINCSMLSITRNVSTCNPATNTYSVSGNIEFTNPPNNGVLTISNDQGVSQSFNPPFNSPQNYSLNGVPCDGLNHTITAVFSTKPACTLTQTYTAPIQASPSAIISGGGNACGTTNTVPVYINITGSIPPYTFNYAINNIAQPTVSNYNGPFPYVINANQPGTYTLVDVTSTVIAGTVSGTASVAFLPVPVIDLGPTIYICPGTSTTIDAGAGFSKYQWSTGASTQSITVTTAGTYSITVTNIESCTTDDSVEVIIRDPVTAAPIKHF